MHILLTVFIVFSLASCQDNDEPGIPAENNDPVRMTAQKFVGSWDLKAWTAESAEGQVVHPFGDDTQGRITYDYRVSSLVLGSPCIDIAAWEQSTTQLLQTLPDSLQHAVLYADSSGNYDDPLYEVAINAFYDKYLWGSHVVEADLDSMISTANLDIYNYMWGPSELAPKGTLKHYNGMEDLQDIDVPTLFTVGEHDEIQPSFVKEMASPFTNSRIEVFANASHLTTWDARDENIRVVREFLTELDSNAALQN